MASVVVYDPSTDPKWDDRYAYLLDRPGGLVQGLLDELKDQRAVTAGLRSSLMHARAREGCTVTQLMHIWDYLRGCLEVDGRIVPQDLVAAINQDRSIHDPENADELSLVERCDCCGTSGEPHVDCENCRGVGWTLDQPPIDPDMFPAQRYNELRIERDVIARERDLLLEELGRIKASLETLF
jgi:hypothetical protein